MPISPAPVSDHGDDGLPPYLSNGVLGLRVRDIPLLNGTATMTGLTGLDPVDDIEGAPFIPYPLALDIEVNGVSLAGATDRVQKWRQQYDFGCGELHSRFTSAVADVRVDMEIVTFCSRTQPVVVCQQTNVKVDRKCEMSVRAGVDTANVPGRLLERAAAAPHVRKDVADGALVWETRGELGHCGLAFWSQIVDVDDVERVTSGYGADARLRATRRFEARPGRTFRIEQLTAAVGEIAHHQPDRAAVRLLKRARDAGFDSLREENAVEWERLWQARPVLHGAPERWQALADGAFFYLNSSVHSSSVSSVHLFGLSRWIDYHYYYGHVMWDLEVFALPPLLLMQPEAARAILDYRFRSLPAARMNARLNGYSGIQFPWESEPSRGEEATPLDGTAPFFEQHVSMGVARAFTQFLDATADGDFLRDRAWPVVQGVAEFLSSRVTKTDRGYEIQSVMGIAEREKPSDNVAYMNMAAELVLRDASAIARKLGINPPARWEDIADDLVLPYNDDGSVVLDHDGWNPGEEKGATPSTLAGIFPIGYNKLDPAVERSTIEYYLGLWEDYIGSPMLSSMYGAWAARIGDRDRALHLLDEGYAQFVSPRFMNVHEYRDDKFPEMTPAGPFFANLGGFLIDCYFGFPGIRMHEGPPEEWWERPVVLPAGWDCIEVERMWARGRPYRMSARHGAAHASIEPLD
jgi:hypothetical protein